MFLTKKAPKILLSYTLCRAPSRATLAKTLSSGLLTYGAYKVLMANGITPSSIVKFSGPEEPIDQVPLEAVPEKSEPAQEEPAPEESSEVPLEAIPEKSEPAQEEPAPEEPASGESSQAILEVVPEKSEPAQEEPAQEKSGQDESSPPTPEASVDPEASIQEATDQEQQISNKEFLAKLAGIHQEILQIAQILDYNPEPESLENVLVVLKPMVYNNMFLAELRQVIFKLKETVPDLKIYFTDPSAKHTQKLAAMNLNGQTQSP
jgi:hypothetical protein